VAAQQNVVRPEKLLGGTMSGETIPKRPVSTKSRITPDEANLLWDEYKYRHDLIWKHLIRSTVVVVALITVSYSTEFEEDRILFIIAALLAVGYTIFSFIVLNSELTLFEKIKVLHRRRQDDLYKLHTDTEPMPKELVGAFSIRARLYLAGLLLLAFAAAVSHLF
jgi:hypothetical protein